MALSFACHKCGEQRTLNADGGADPCPQCGAGLPGEDEAANESQAEANESDDASDDGEDAAEDDGLPGAPIQREPLPSETAAADRGDEASDDGASDEASGDEASGDEASDSEADGDESSDQEVEAPPVHAPPVQAAVGELDDFDEGEPGESLDLTPKNGREEGDMDMTPMVDVTFLLLIFFMITAAFSLQKSIEVPKPKETDQASTQVQEEEEEKDQTITVIIDQYNTFRVQTADSEEEAPGKHDLLRKLRRARDSAPSPDSIPNKLVVRAHGDATHERVVIALDAGVEVGMEEVQLITIEEDL